MGLKAVLDQFLRKQNDPVATFPDVWDLETAARERGWEYREILPASIQVSPGGKTISEDFLQWIDNGRHLLRVHRDAHRGLEFSRYWAAHLHAVRRYPVDKVFHCTLPDATLLTEDGGVVTDRGELAWEAFFGFDPIRRSEWQNRPEKALKGRFISLLTHFGDRNIGHFFFDAILRVALFDDLSGFQFLLPANLQPWHRGMLEAVGVAPEQIVQRETLCTRLEELVVCHIAQQGYLPRREVVSRFREKVLGKLKHPPEQKPPFRRLFTDRSRAKQRKITNQKELEPILKERGFEIIQWENLTIAEQVTHAFEAEIIAGPHGSSLVNCAYCQPGAKILEILNPSWWDGSNLRQSTLMGHEFWYTIGENASKGYDTRVDPRKFERVLDYMLDRPSTDPPLP